MTTWDNRGWATLSTLLNLVSENNMIKTWLKPEEQLETMQCLKSEIFCLAKDLLAMSHSKVTIYIWHHDFCGLDGQGNLGLSLISC